MTTLPPQRNGLHFACQIFAAASTIVVGSALVIAVILLTVALCKHGASLISGTTSPDEYVHQTMHFSINSEPPGARLYTLDSDTSLESFRCFGRTPYANAWSYFLDTDGSGGAWGGYGLALDNGAGAYQMQLRCIIAKDGYQSQILTQVLATILHPATSNDLPTHLNYTAVLKPVASRLKRVGRAQLVNGRAVAVVPGSLDVTEGVYEIDILGSDKAE